MAESSRRGGKKKLRVAAAIRCGKLCKGCRGKCSDPPTVEMPVIFECPDCEGTAIECESCNMTGEFKVTCCPNEYVGDVRNAIPLFDLFAKGMPPISGGVLDQANWFVAAYRTLQQEESAVMAEDNA